MSNTNTNTNNSQNRNQNSRSGGRTKEVPVGEVPAIAVTMMIAKYKFERKMKDSRISKLLITKTGHRPTQFKKIIDTLSVLCVDENFQGLDEVLWTGIDPVESNSMLTYPDATWWSNAHHVEIQTVAPGATIDATTGVCPFICIVGEQTHVFDANLQKQLLSEYKRKSKNKSLEYWKFLTNKKALITIILDSAMKQPKPKVLSKKPTQWTVKQNLINFINRLQTLCFGGDDGGLSYWPYKQVIAIKSMNNYTNNEPYNPHSFKEQIKIKYEDTKAISRKFPNRIAALMELLTNAQPALDWDAYCALTADQQLVWELRMH